MSTNTIYVDTIYVGTDDVGTGYLVTIWDDGTAELAIRFPDEPRITWSRPVALEAVS